MELENAENLDEKETEGKISYLRKRILTLEWDKENNQLNTGMMKQYDELKKEYNRLNEKLKIIKSGKEEES